MPAQRAARVAAETAAAAANRRRSLKRRRATHETLLRPQYAAFSDGGALALVLEPAVVDVWSRLSAQPGGRFGEERAVREVVAPFLSAMAHVHSRNIIHRRAHGGRGRLCGAPGRPLPQPAARSPLASLGAPHHPTLSLPKKPSSPSLLPTKP
jgi:hypothetical protein